MWRKAALFWSWSLVVSQGAGAPCGSAPFPHVFNGSKCLGAFSAAPNSIRTVADCREHCCLLGLSKCGVFQHWDYRGGGCWTAPAPELCNREDSSWHAEARVAVPPPPPPPPPPPDYPALFTSGDSIGDNITSQCFRIPSLGRLSNGNLIAVAEARIHSCWPDDPPGNAIVAKVALDPGGKNWSAIKIVQRFINDSSTGPQIATDALHNTTYVYWSRAYGGHVTRGHAVQWQYGSFWGAKTTDNGLTWVDFNVSAANTWEINSAGGGGAFQLPDGRLVMACNDAGKLAVCTSRDGVVYERGAHVLLLAGQGECQLIWDGRGPESVAMFIRVGKPGEPLVNHALALSTDLGATWGNTTFLPALRGSTNEASLARDPTAPVGSGKILLSSNLGTDASLNGRRNLTVWSLQLPPLGSGPAPVLEPKIEGTIWSPPASYSSFTADGRWNLFEGGTRFRYQSLMLVSMDRF